MSAKHLIADEQHPRMYANPYLWTSAIQKSSIWARKDSKESFFFPFFQRGRITTEFMKSSHERGLNSESIDFPKRMMKAPSADIIIFGVMEREDGCCVDCA